MQTPLKTFFIDLLNRKFPSSNEIPEAIYTYVQNTENHPIKVIMESRKNNFSFIRVNPFPNLFSKNLKKVDSKYIEAIPYNSVPPCRAISI